MQGEEGCKIMKSYHKLRKKFYHNLTYKEKMKRTLSAGVPMLIGGSIIIIFLAPNITEKIVGPIILFIIWLIQLIYTYKKSTTSEEVSKK